MQIQRQQSLVSEGDTAKIQIFFSAKNLVDLDVLSVTDSFLKVYRQFTNKHKELMLTTRIKWNDLNPDFSQTLILDFNFQVRQQIIVEVYHQNSPPTFIGVIKSTVGEIFGSRNRGLQKTIFDSQKNNRGQFIFKCEKIEQGYNNYIQFQMKGIKLDSGFLFLCFGSPQCLYRIYKIKNNIQYLLHQSEWQSGKNPIFDPLKINEKKLCNCDSNQKITIRFYSQSQISAPIFIGEFQTSLLNLQKINNQRHPLTQGSKERGKCQLLNFRQNKVYQFADYLASGMQMALVICIDFTASNGNWRQQSSLHRVLPNRKSKYEEALFETTRILMDYDTDKLVPTYGFGAKVQMPNFNTHNSTHHCFPLNGNRENPNFYQIDGIIEGYRNSLQYLQFSGPTYFAPLLQEAMQQCRQMKQQVKEYMILLILTDGAIHDIDKVMDLLVKCGRLPLSVVIIGIGDQGQWDLMHKLDDDDCQMVDFQGNRTQRDLVQFVQFSKHQNDGVAIAREVLFELPRQVEEYHQLVGLTPEDYGVHKVTDINLQMQNSRNVKKY